MMKPFSLNEVNFTKYIFFTGKGGVGKTSIACAVAVSLADQGKKVLLISTDPASNLQDVFGIDLENHETEVPDVPGLTAVNIDPEKAAAEYRESVVAPYREKLPESAIANMEEQLSGSCTVEIAAFNAFSGYLTDRKLNQAYDHIIFDTAPTGHTLRMLQLPSAWSGFLEDNKKGASCLGQLSGLESKKDIYKHAVRVLGDKSLTTLVLVTRPESLPLKEAANASVQLGQLGIQNQILIINGLLDVHSEDKLSAEMYRKQQEALSEMPPALAGMKVFYVPLRAYNVEGIAHIRALLKEDEIEPETETLVSLKLNRLQDVIDDLYKAEKKVIFTMGKGGVGKTTIAAAIALGLADKGVHVHLATTDPAAHLKYVIDQSARIRMSYIDAEKELKSYQEEVLAKARESMSESDLDYVEEDLRSPCTQEIAVFRAFADIVESSKKETVVIDTAPTGHTLLLLDSSLSYHREVERTEGADIPESVRKLLPRLRSPEAEVIIVTLAEATPVYEALRLEKDLKRSGIAVKWWIVNSSFYGAQTSDPLIEAKAEHEISWINRVAEHTDGTFAVVRWSPDEIKGKALRELF
jgi:arsenite-transporting ATPase